MSADDAQTIARTEADIHRAREKVVRSMIALKREIARTMDWREWVCRKPRLSMGLAFGLGFMLARRG